MRLKPEQLHLNLKQGRLAPVYCISGDEPLQILEIADEVRRHARRLGYEERAVLDVERDFDWNRLRQAAAEMSLFSTRKVIDLRLGHYSPGNEGSEVLAEFCARPNPENLLLITSDRLDKQKTNTKWYKAIDKAGATVQIREIKAAELPSWIAERLKRHNKSIVQEAAELLADRIEGNLLAAAQEVEKLALLAPGPVIGLQEVMHSVGDDARYGAFTLIGSALEGDAGRVARILRGIREEGEAVVAVLGAVTWQLRQLSSIATDVAAGMSIDTALGRHHVHPDSLAPVGAALRRMRRPHIASALRQSAMIERAAKGALAADSGARYVKTAGI
ncbi:MAG: DNA polymerase III subunit delta [Gammaproteobacteria bacterium]|nr:DNA polymerase III subunit delta [Gammaproteobacteria bacterium]